MKKLLDSRYLCFTMALFGAIVLPVITLATSAMINALPYFSTRPVYNFPHYIIFPVCTHHIPVGMILGLCFGFTWTKWAQRRSLLKAKCAIACACVAIVAYFASGFAELIKMAYNAHIFIWRDLPFFAFPLLFAIVLFLWGLHLPNQSPQSEF